MYSTNILDLFYFSGIYCTRLLTIDDITGRKVGGTMERTTVVLEFLFYLAMVAGLCFSVVGIALLVFPF